MRTLQVDIKGLDLVLGGGFSLLERVAGAGESATILVRGSAGSGKTVLGTQFAASIARALNTDVAYGCVELLPVELRAQHESVRGELAKEKVVLLNEDAANDPEPAQVRIFAGLLDLEEGKIVEQFGETVELLLDAANARANRKIGVLVVDSLSNGYGLGSRAPRVLADGVCKLAAERGLVVILLEEQEDSSPSVWSFAVDTVFELKPAEEEKPFEHRILVSKNRLGPSDPGPHEFSVRHRRGVELQPRVRAYQRAWRNKVLRKRTAKVEVAHAWYPEGIQTSDWLPPFREVTTAVVGNNSIMVRRVALWLGSKAPVSILDPHSILGHGIVFLMGATGSMDDDEQVQKTKYDYVTFSWGPLQSGASMLSTLRRQIDAQAFAGKIPSRVVIGDLRSIKYHPDPDGVVQAVSATASLMIDMGIPLVLYGSNDESQAGSVAIANADVVYTCFGGVRDDGGRDGKTLGGEEWMGGEVSGRLDTVWKSEEFVLAV